MRSSRRSGAPPRQRRIRRLRLLGLVGVLLLLALSSFALGLVSAVASEIPALDPARQRAFEHNGYVYARDGRSILTVLRGSESRVLVDWDDIAPDMKRAIVAIEDRRFWEHRGVDLRGIARALWADISERAVVQGGSTITQQYVKNAYVRNERSLARKVREAALAWQLERSPKWSKRKILTEYLNTIYFGNGAYGVQQAALAYFGRGARELTLGQAALLAGIPADPSGYDPITQPRAARARREQVLSAMLELGWVDRARVQAARREPLPKPRSVRLPPSQAPTPLAPYFTNYVKDELIDGYGAGRVFGGGLRVKTTIDLGAQRLARLAVRKWLPNPDGPSAALVAIDPTSGEVLAMIGGRNYRESEFNLAVQGERQPGSAFKPFVLAAALERGIAPQTAFESKPVELWLGDRFWRVENYEDAYLGTIDLEAATVHSDNAVYAQLARLVGPANVVAVAKRLGIRSPLRNYFSIALGAQAVNPLELAYAFSVFANGGYVIESKRFPRQPRVVEEVRNRRGRVVDENPPRSRRVLSARTAALVNDLLQETVERGTARRAALPGWAVAGKTGTTEEYGDAWFVGYTPELVTAVWVGYPERLRPMLTEFRGEPVAGGTYPALIWKSFMERALPYLGKKPEPFAEPPPHYTVVHSVVRDGNRLLRDNGVCRDAVTVVAFAGREPKRTADCKENAVDVPRVVGQTLAAARARLSAQPLTPRVIYKPAEPRQRVDIVVGQIPARGTLSAYDDVKIVLAKPLHGVVPRVEGVRLAAARARLRRASLRAVVTRFTDGRPGRVVAQRPAPGVAAAPGMTVRLAVGR